jgi:hypothetical protein
MHKSKAKEKQSNGFFNSLVLHLFAGFFIIVFILLLIDSLEVLSPQALPDRATE